MTVPTFVDGVVVHTGPLNAMSASVTAMSLATLGAAPPRSYVPMVKLRRVASQTFPVSTRTLLSWDTVDRNTDAMFTLTTPTQITVNTPGSYGIDCQMSFGSRGDGTYRQVWMLLNGTEPLINTVAVDEQLGVAGMTGQGNTMHLHTVLPNLTVGNVLYVMVYHTSVTSLASSTLLPYPMFGMWRTGP